MNKGLFKVWAYPWPWAADVKYKRRTKSLHKDNDGVILYLQVLTPSRLCLWVRCVCLCVHVFLRVCTCMDKTDGRKAHRCKYFFIFFIFLF